jgi:putative oxidoreductase
MMGFRGLARTLLAGTFVMGGLGAWKRSTTLAEKAAPVTDPIESRLRVGLSSEQFVQANAVVQVVGGGLFALGVWPRAMALVLGASLVPTTIAGHAFWDADDHEERNAQRTQFLKNAGLLGGLLFAALDTGGRPSVFWSGRKAIGDAADAVSSTVSSTGQSLSDRLPTS